MTSRERAALHMLHAQAHGDVPMRTCQQEPCRDLPAHSLSSGPAPLTLVGVGR